MRYPIDGILNFFLGNLALCHAFIANPYSLPMRFNVSKSARLARACKNSSFLSRAFWANSSMFYVPFLRDVSIEAWKEQGDLWKISH